MVDNFKFSNLNFFWLSLLFCGLFGVTGQFVGNETVTFVQKFLLLIIIFAALFLFGVVKQRLFPLFFFTVAVFFSALGAFFLETWIDYKLLVISYLSLAMPFLLFSVNFSKANIICLAKIVVFLPLLCVGVGLLFVPFGIEPWVIEFSGAFRLRGAAIPPHLAMLCVVAVFVHVYFLFRNIRFKYDFSILLLNFVVLYLTATRGALIASILALLPLAKIYLSNKNRYRELFFLAMILFSFLFAYFGYDNFMLRNAESSGEEPFNLSGRAIAWEYFMHIIEINPWFGTGLGSVTLMTQFEIESNLANFVVPHNEYIRFLVDLGGVGMVLIFIPIFSFAIIKIIRIKDVSKVCVFFALFATSIYAASDNLLSTIQFSLPFSVYTLLCFGDFRWNLNRS